MSNLAAGIPSGRLESTWADHGDDSVVEQGSRSPFQRIRRIVHALSGGVHARYLAALVTAHLIPRFSAGPVVAHLYRLAGFKIGTDATFGGPVRILGGERQFTQNLVIGDHVLISTDVTINVDALVYIGDRVSIGPLVQIYTANHPVGPSSQRMSRDHANRPVTIEHGTWIRLGATILPGVTVGHGSIIGAGSVVTRSVPPNSYVEGNPAQVLRTLNG